MLKRSNEMHVSLPFTTADINCIVKTGMRMLQCTSGLSFINLKKKRFTSSVLLPLSSYTVGNQFNFSFFGVRFKVVKMFA